MYNSAAGGTRTTRYADDSTEVHANGEAPTLEKVKNSMETIKSTMTPHSTWRFSPVEGTNPRGGSFWGTMEGVRCAEGYGAKCWFGESSMCLTGYSVDSPTEVVHAQIAYGTVSASNLSCWDTNGPLGSVGVLSGGGFTVDGIWVIRGAGATIGLSEFTLFGNTNRFTTVAGTGIGIEFFVNTSTLADVIDRYEAGGSLKENVLQTYGRIERWNVKHITSMAYAFYNRPQFNSDIR